MTIDARRAAPRLLRCARCLCALSDHTYRDDRFVCQWCRSDCTHDPDPTLRKDDA